MTTDEPERPEGRIILFPPRPGAFVCDRCRKSFTTGRLHLERGVVVSGTCQACTPAPG